MIFDGKNPSNLIFNFYGNKIRYTFLIYHFYYIPYF
jgi:hypothetical protein